ncbi:NmrA family protein [Paraphaeosphaeria sporulosa]
MPRHILVFGGTSPAGIDFSLAALRDGHTLTLYVRNASKLPPEIRENATIHTGQLNDAAAVEKAVASGAKTCVSFLGPVMSDLKRGSTPITNGYATILPLLEKHAYERTLFISTASYRAPHDRFSLAYSFMIWGVYLFARAAYEEINAMTRLMVALPSEMNWTVFRVPMLKSGEARAVKAGMVGEVGVMLDRKGLAEWVLREMEEGKWVGRCVAVANA